MSGVVGGGFGGGLKGQPAQLGPDGLPIQGSDDDQYESNISVEAYDKDGNLTDIYSLADKPSGLLAMASTTGLKNTSNVLKTPTGLNPDGSKQTQKQINDAWIAYYNRKKKLETEALAKEQAEDRSLFDKAKEFFGLDNDETSKAQGDNAINTGRNASTVAARLPGTGTMAAGDTLLGAGPAVYGGLDIELRKDYDYFVQYGELPEKRGASAFSPYAKARQRINNEFIEKHKGLGWTEPGRNGRSPQNDIWGKK